MRILLVSTILLFAFMAKAQSDFYVKEVVFASDADSVAKIEMASRVIPTPEQLAWQDLELTAFIHFGVNTFTGREWGNGRELPEIFNPTMLDADQWVTTLKNAGFKMLILTAKHHDGFCLWPTATTTHSVAASPWRDGKGDVVAEVSEACRRHGMKLGLYLSPWDRNAPSYGDSPRYNDLYVEQLTELLTNYGKIDEIWLDSACGEGPDGKKQIYDWQRFKQTIRQLQPEAVIAISGDDIRWVGNEKGLGRETEWSVTPLTSVMYADADSVNASLKLVPKSPDLGSRDIIAKADRVSWWPSEVDVSIRPGWFYHAEESPKTLRQLAEIYLNSVGRNSVLLLNVPPDTCGLICRDDSVRLAELKDWIDNNFSTALLAGDKKMEPATEVNCVVLREDISRGQRIEKFVVQGLRSGQWVTLAEGTTVGHKRILTFEPAVVDDLRVEILESRAKPNLMPLEAYKIDLPEN